jgi:hypothetical protein
MAVEPLNPMHARHGLVCLASLCSALQLIAAAPAPAAADAVRPLIAIEAGAHLQRVENLFDNASRDEIVSTSVDGTVRIWSATDGKLLKTLVLPICAGKAAHVEKAGMSRHGGLLALGLSWPDAAIGHWVALYEIDAAAPPRMHHVSAQVTSVAFSDDERRIAIATWDQVNVFRLPEFEVIATDKFSDVVWGLDFDPTGRLVAGSFDGQVRLYDKERFWPIAKTNTSTGKQINDIKFSPDGSRIAVGFNTGTAVEILSDQGLTQVAALKPGAAEYDELSRVAWSPDGQTVFALGSPKVPGESGKLPSEVLSWQLESGGGGSWLPFRSSPKVAQIHRTANSALNFAPIVADGSLNGFAVSLWNGDVYAINLQGRQLWHSPRVKAYFDEPRPSDLLVSEHGDVVSFAFGPGKDQHFCIDLNAAALTAGNCANAALRPPFSLPALDISRGTISGKSIDLDRWESIAAGVIAPDEKSFVLGTRMNLRKIGLDGKSLWAVDPGSEVWAVNVTRDGRFAIAALGDGRLGWYDMATGKEALSLFVHADGARWAAWTPDGHFYAPPGSRELVVGFESNRDGPAVPTPIAADALFAACYRADLLTAVLGGAPPQPK